MFDWIERYHPENQTIEAGSEQLSPTHWTLIKIDQK